MKFDLQTKVARAYVTASRNGAEGVDAERLRTQIPDVSAGTLALNNNFFVEMGLLERVGKGTYRPTAPLTEFNRRFGWNKDDARAQLRPVFETTWAYEAVERRLQLGPASIDEMVQTLGAEARADASYAPQLRTLLDWLEFSGAIKLDDEMVALAKGTPAPAVEQETKVEEKPPGGPVVEVPGKVQEPTKDQPQPPAIVSLSIDVALTADDLAKLTPEQIKSLFEGVGAVAAIKAALA
jgi:hypothetical protein